MAKKGIISIIQGKEVELFQIPGETGEKLPKKFDFSPIF